MKRVVTTSVIIVSAAASAAPIALAQNVDPFARERFTAVQDRIQPDFDPEPVQFGPLVVNSSLGLGAWSTDNVFGQSVGPVDDTVFTVTPKFDARTTWSRNELRFGARSETREFQDQDGESTTDYGGYLAGRFDVTSRFAFGAQVEATRNTEPRYAPASISGAAEPTRYDRFTGELNSTWRNDRVQLESGIGRISDDFEDVPAVAPATATIDQDFRDADETYYRGRASYAVSPDVAFFVQGRYAEIDFDAPAVQGSPTRDSKRTNAQIGASFELSSPLRGDVAIGYIQEEKDAALPGDVSDFDGLSADARVQWFPTELTTITFTANRSVFDPGLFVGRTAVGTNGGARVDHELRRNIVLFAEGRIGSYEFQDIDRTDDTNEVTLGAGYKANKHIRIDAGYTFRNYDSSGRNADRESTGVARAFDQNIFSLNLRFFP